MARVVILGAGLTGLSTAYHLEKNNFFDFKIFEKESTVGGLCRSVTEQGFTFDYTGHLLHSNDPYFSNFLAQIVGYENLNIIKRRAFIYSHNTYTHFPFQVNLHGLPHDVIIECIEGFIERPQSRTKPASFYEWALKKFGAGITKHFFVPYQEKIFAYDIKKISASWTGRFVPDTSLKAILQGALSEPSAQSIGYNSHFYYPRQGGINFLIDKIADSITSPIKTNYCVQNVDMINKIVTFTNGDFEPFDILVNTLPLDSFLDCLQEPAALSLKKHAPKLLCNSVINFNLGINRPDISDKHWVYLPEKQFTPYRLGFYHSFSQDSVPVGCNSLYGEIAYLRKPPAPVASLVKQSTIQMQNLLGFSDSDIIANKVMEIKHAYVIFDFWREKNLPKMHKTLKNHHIHSIGRYGAWKYASMQESVLDGKVMAEKLIADAGIVPFIPTLSTPITLKGNS